jgi:serine/threonine protein kinase
LKLTKYEAGILSHLKGIHGVPDLYKYYEVRGLQIMVMEYLGRDLDSILRKHKSVSVKVSSSLQYVLTFVGHCFDRVPDDRYPEKNSQAPDNS